MTLPLQEPFSGAAGVLATPPWTQEALSATTLNYDGAGSGKASAADGVKTVYAYDNLNVYSPDQYAQHIIIFGLASGSNHADLIVRASGAGVTVKHYEFYTDGASGAGHTDLRIRWNGVATLLRSFATTFVSGDGMRIEIAGKIITCYKDGAALGTYDTSGDANQIATGAAGCGVFNSATNQVLIDTWQGGNLPAAVGGAGFRHSHPQVTRASF